MIGTYSTVYHSLLTVYHILRNYIEASEAFHTSIQTTDHSTSTHFSKNKNLAGTREVLLGRCTHIPAIISLYPKRAQKDAQWKVSSSMTI